MLASFVRSVVASLVKESEFSFPSVPWCENLKIIPLSLLTFVRSFFFFLFFFFFF